MPMAKVGPKTTYSLDTYRMWWNIAGANGDDVEVDMGILTGKMSQDDISKAQEKTTQYIQDHPDGY